MMLAKADFFLISFVKVLEAEPVGFTPGWVASSCQHLGAGTLLKGTSAMSWHLCCHQHAFQLQLGLEPTTR